MHVIKIHMLILLKHLSKIYILVSMSSWVHTEKSFRNLIKSNRNQIVFTIFRFIWNSKQTSIWIQINLTIVNTIWFRFDLKKNRKCFSKKISHMLQGFHIDIWRVLAGRGRGVGVGLRGRGVEGPWWRQVLVPRSAAVTCDDN